MINRRKIHHYWRYFKSIKTWQLFIVFIILISTSIMALRRNSQNLEPLVEAVIIADETGKGTDEAVRQLGNYMSSHMNTLIDEPIQLAQTYQRDADKILQQTQATSDGSIYKLAQKECENPNVLLSVRAACIQDYVTRNVQPGQEPQTVKFPDTAAYTFEFVSPRWSPDLAGWLSLASVWTGVVLISRFLAGMIVKRVLKNRQ
jgi:hypothetical protein